MISSLFISLITVIVILAVIALCDSKIESLWGSPYSFPRAILFFLAVVSGVYQISLLFHCLWLFRVIDITALSVCFVYHRNVFLKFKEYGTVLFIKPWREGEKILYCLYFFIGYLFFLSIFSVQGWDWDSMIFHLSRPFLYLNEQTIFTTHYSDPRQVAWPMGGDILFYIFTRYGETFGTGFISFICTMGALVAIVTHLRPVIGIKRANTLLFIIASIPVLIYSSTTVKGEPLAVFAFVMMWIAFCNFHESRQRIDLYTLILAFAFGLSCKMTFVFAAAFSVIAFFIFELWNRKPLQLTGPKLSWKWLMPLLFISLFLSQLHLYLFNFKTFGHIAGPTAALVNPMTPIIMLQNFFKYQLELIDFVLPLSSIGISFIDTFLSALYNHTIGALTGDTPWQFHYFPQEMNASFGPFGFFLIWIGVYKTLLGRSKLLERLFAAVVFANFLFIVFKFPRDDNISILRYLAPVLIASVVMLPTIYNNSLLRFEKSIRWTCLALFAFCVVINYAKPLVAYNPKAIPWYRYAFTHRDFLYKEKHFFDDRIEIFSKEVQPDDKVLILSKPNVWMYPYYQHAGQTKIRLENYITLSPHWLEEHLKEYSLIVCEDTLCQIPLRERKGLLQIWESLATLPRPAAFYRPKKPL